MKKFHAVVFCFLFPTCIATANAAILASRCNGCTPVQANTAATNVAEARNLAHGFVHTYDLTNQVLGKYAVSREPAYNGWIYHLEPTPLNATETAAWSGARNALAGNGGSSTFFAHINAGSTADFPNRSASVHDILLTGAYQNDISDWLLFGPGSNVIINDAGLTTVSLVSIATTIVLQSDLFTFTVTVVTADGGTLDFHWEAGYNHATITRMLDADGNPIPIRIAQLPGRYRFSPGREPIFRDYLRDRFGHDVSWGPGVCTNGILACSSSPAGYNCDWFSCGGVP